MTVQRILDISEKALRIAHIAPDATVAQVLDSPEFQEVGAVVVSSDGRTIEGIISEHDIVLGLRRIGSDLSSTPVRELMTAKVVTCAPHDRAAGIIALMVSRHIRHVPVVTEGKLVGMVSVHDVLNLRIKEGQAEAQAMQNYIQGNT